jgi:hypothetical protein
MPAPLARAVAGIPAYCMGRSSPGTCVVSGEGGSGGRGHWTPVAALSAHGALSLPERLLDVGVDWRVYDGLLVCRQAWGVLKGPVQDERQT